MTGMTLDAGKRIAVIGAGTMGAGIAQVAATAGHVVYLYDAAPGAVDRAHTDLVARLGRSVDKGRMAGGEADDIAARIVAIDSLEALADSSLVIEAIVEDLGVKQEVLRQIETLVADDTVIASNTSSLSVTAIAAALQRPARVVGIHFFNPAPVMPLVEIVRGEATASEVVDLAETTVTGWGKTTVRCASTPGFIVNRIARPFYGEALRMLGEGTANASTIDAVVTGSGRFRMGPFALMDLVGLDVNLSVSKSVYAQTFHDARFAPHVIQQGLVDAGRLGRKTGRGFHDYSHAHPDPAEAVHSVDVSFRNGPPKVLARGDLGHAAGLVDRLVASGVEVSRVAPDEELGHLRSGPAVLVPTDGRTATELAASGLFGTNEVAVVDLADPWADTETVAVAGAAQATGNPALLFAGLIQQTGIAVSVVADTPGLVLMRIVAQLASVAADAVTTGVATAADIDTAMKLGTNYPRGPLEWADAIGPAVLVDVLDHLRSFYGEDRYRAAGRLRTAAWTVTGLRSDTNENRPTGGDQV